MKSIYNVFSYSKNDLKLLFNEMASYNKIRSIILLKLLGIPVLDFVIVTKWDNSAIANINKFAKKIKSKSFLLRHDKAPEVPIHPRGGYIVKYDDLESECNKYFVQNRVVLLLEPFSPYDNVYNVNILYERDRLVFEILGKGFDASDIQRGDTLLHESFEFLNSESYQEDLIPISHNVISEQYYRKTIEQRYKKIGRRLIDFGLISNCTDDSCLIEQVKHYLIKNNFNLLLENEQSYSKILMNNIKTIYDYIFDLDRQMRQFYTNVKLPFVISMSMFNKPRRINFWDIVFPSLKYKF